MTLKPEDGRNLMFQAQYAYDAKIFIDGRHQVECANFESQS